MRIASVLHDASPDHDGAPLVPTLALERDGALYSVAALARAFGGRCRGLFERDVDGDGVAMDFHHAVVALGGATLFELDERLKRGERPSAARLRPGTFSWLAPCDTERAAVFERVVGSAAASERESAALVGASGAGRERERVAPVFRVGLGRGLLGHEARVPLVDEGAAVEVTCAVAVMLADELWWATAAEAEHAILGCTLSMRWRPVAGGAERAGVAGSGVAQLGPVLVTADELGGIERLRMQLRIAGAPCGEVASGAPGFSAAETIAWLSHHVPLRAGDVVGLGPGAGGERDRGGGRVTLAFDARADFAAERLGRLSGLATRGPEMRGWRRG